MNATLRDSWALPSKRPVLAIGAATALVATRSGRGVIQVGAVAEAAEHWRGRQFAALFASPADAILLADVGIAAIAVTGDDLDSAEAALAAGAADVIAADASASEVLALLGHTPLVMREAGALSVSNLAELSVEAARIARALDNLVRDRVPGEEPEPQPVTADFVRQVIRARRARARFFAGELFADPAWDILLDLMAARLERKAVSVSSLCIAAAVPATTALRYIKTMTDEGLLVRQPDPMDGRRVFIELAPQTAEKMHSYLSQSARVAQLV